MVGLRSRVKEMILHVDGLNSIRQCFSHFSIDLRSLCKMPASFGVLMVFINDRIICKKHTF